MIDTGKIDSKYKDTLEPDNIKVICRDHFLRERTRVLQRISVTLLLITHLGKSLTARGYNNSVSLIVSHFFSHTGVLSPSGQVEIILLTRTNKPMKCLKRMLTLLMDQEAIMPRTAASAKKPAAKKTKSSNTQAVMKTSQQPPASFSFFASESYEKTQYDEKFLLFIICYRYH